MMGQLYEKDKDKFDLSENSVKHVKVVAEVDSINIREFIVICSLVS